MSEKKDKIDVPDDPQVDIPVPKKSIVGMEIKMGAGGVEFGGLIGQAVAKFQVQTQKELSDIQNQFGKFQDELEFLKTFISSVYDFTKAKFVALESKIRKLR